MHEAPITERLCSASGLKLLLNFFVTNLSFPDPDNLDFRSDLDVKPFSVLIFQLWEKNRPNSCALPENRVSISVS